MPVETAVAETVVKETSLVETLLVKMLLVEMLLVEIVDLGPGKMNTVVQVRVSTYRRIHSRLLGQSSLVPRIAHSFGHILLSKGPCKIDQQIPRARPV